MSDSQPVYPVAETLRIAASLPAHTDKELQEFTLLEQEMRTRILMGLLTGDHRVRSLLIGLIQEVAPVRYVLDYNKLRVNTKVVSQRSSRFGMWIGATIGFVIGVLVAIFYRPGTVDVTDANTLQVVLTTILTPLWGKFFFVAFMAAVGLSTGAPFDKPRQDVVHELLYIDEDGTEHTIHRGGFVPSRVNN